MAVFQLFMLLIGLTGLVLGAELLVKKAGKLAKYLRMPPFFIGVILLGMGTSAPEWAVSTLSSIKKLTEFSHRQCFWIPIYLIFYWS